MTDADLVAKKLAAIETAVTELKTLARPESVESDVREARFVERTLQIAIQGVISDSSPATVVIRRARRSRRRPTATCS